MAKDLIQYGFRLERDDRDWFIKACDDKGISAATVLSGYIKKCRDLGVIDPLGGDNNQVGISAHLDEEVGVAVQKYLKDNPINVADENTIESIVNIVINTQLTEILNRLDKLEKTESVGDADKVKGNRKLTPKHTEEMVDLYRTTAHNIGSLAAIYMVDSNTISRTLKLNIPEGEYKNLINSKNKNR
jgi:hypothetical protein